MAQKAQKPVDDDQDKAELDEPGEEAAEKDAWCIATWAGFHSIGLHFVVEVDDKPAPHLHTCTACYQAYKWHSYHAARKFLRTHPELEGYIIVNLTEIFRQRDLVKSLEDKRWQINREKERFNPNVRSSLGT